MFWGNCALYFCSVAQHAWSLDPVHVPLEHRLPQRLHVGARPDQRVHLGVDPARAVGIEREMADGHLALEADVREEIIISAASIAFFDERCSRLMLRQSVS